MKTDAQVCDEDNEFMHPTFVFTCESADVVVDLGNNLRYRGLMGDRGLFGLLGTRGSFFPCICVPVFELVVSAWASSNVRCLRSFWRSVEEASPSSEWSPSFSSSSGTVSVATLLLSSWSTKPNTHTNKSSQWPLYYSPPGQQNIFRTFIHTFTWMWISKINLY